eukprot:6866708-Prymnesium_polylepis.1
MTRSRECRVPSGLSRLAVSRHSPVSRHPPRPAAVVRSRRVARPARTSTPVTPKRKSENTDDKTR